MENIPKRSFSPTGGTSTDHCGSVNYFIFPFSTPSLLKILKKEIVVFQDHSPQKLTDDALAPSLHSYLSKKEIR